MKKNMIALIAGAAALCIMAAGCGSQTTGTAGSAAAVTASLQRTLQRQQPRQKRDTGMAGG